MNAPKKADEKGTAKEAAVIEYVVARGRTVYVDDVPNGPGRVISMEEGEAAHLVESGFLRPVEDVAATPALGVRVGGLQINGGRRPGGTIA